MRLSTAPHIRAPAPRGSSQHAVECGALARSQRDAQLAQGRHAPTTDRPRHMRRGRHRRMALALRRRGREGRPRGSRMHSRGISARRERSASMSSSTLRLGESESRIEWGAGDAQEWVTGGVGLGRVRDAVAGGRLEVDEEVERGRRGDSTDVAIGPARRRWWVGVGRREEEVARVVGVWRRAAREERRGSGQVVAIDPPDLVRSEAARSGVQRSWRRRRHAWLQRGRHRRARAAPMPNSVLPAARAHSASFRPHGAARPPSDSPRAP